MVNPFDFNNDDDPSLNREEFFAYLKSIGVDQPKVQERIFLKFDIHRDGVINGGEFKRYKVHNPDQGSPEKNVRKLVFWAFDRSNDGTLDENEYIHYVKAVTHGTGKYNKETAIRAFRNHDKDHSGRLTFRESEDLFREYFA